MSSTVSLRPYLYMANHRVDSSRKLRNRMNFHIGEHRILNLDFSLYRCSIIGAVCMNQYEEVEFQIS